MNLITLKLPSYDTIFYGIIFILFICIFTVTKQVVGAYYLLVIVGIFAIKISKFRIKDFPKEVLIYFSIIFLILLDITISLLIHQDSSHLFKWRYAVYRDLIFLPVIYVAFSASNIKFDTFLKLFVSASLINCFWDVMILIEHPPRDTSWLSDVTNRGNIGMLTGLICLLATIYFKNIKWKTISLIGFFSGILLSILSGARGGWLAFFIVVLTLIYQQAKTNKSSIKYILSASFIMVLLIFFLWDKLPLGPRIEQTIHSINLYFSGDKYSSVGARFEMWYASWLAFLEKPIFGWGWGNTKTYLAYYLELGAVDQNGIYKLFGHPHSEYFLFLAELGITGFIIFIAFLLYPLLYFSRALIYLNTKKDNINTFLCLLPIITLESTLVFCIADDSLSGRPPMLILVIITIFSFALISKSSKELQ